MLASVKNDIQSTGCYLVFCLPSWDFQNPCATMRSNLYSLRLTGIAGSLGQTICFLGSAFQHDLHHVLVISLVADACVLQRTVRLTFVFPSSCALGDPKPLTSCHTFVLP